MRLSISCSFFFSPRSYDSESTDTLLDAHQMNDGSITPNSVSTMGSDNYYLSAKQSDAPTPTPPSATGGGGGGTGNSKERKKHDRFNGMSEEEVCKRTLPDHLDTNLDVVIVSTVDFQTALYQMRARVCFVSFAGFRFIFLKWFCNTCVKESVSSDSWGLEEEGMNWM